MRKLVNEEIAAAYIGCSIHKMQRDRRTGSAIPFIKVGRSVRYDVNDLDEYLQKRKFNSTSQYGGVK